MNAQVHIRKFNPLAMAWMAFLLFGTIFLYQNDQDSLREQPGFEASSISASGFTPITVEDIVIR